jgi:hypothetical protein
VREEYPERSAKRKVWIGRSAICEIGVKNDGTSFRSRANRLRAGGKLV